MLYVAVYLCWSQSPSLSLLVAIYRLHIKKTNLWILVLYWISMYWHKLYWWFSQKKGITSAKSGRRGWRAGPGVAPLGLACGREAGPARAAAKKKKKKKGITTQAWFLSNEQKQVSTAIEQLRKICSQFKKRKKKNTGFSVSLSYIPMYTFVIDFYSWSCL